MQLLSMEVNQLGTADRTSVGPLSTGLNAVCGRRGSGKTALVQWLRGIINPQAPVKHAGSTELASGRVTLRLADGEYQLERPEHGGRTSSKVLRRATQTWNGESVNGRNGHAHAKRNGPSTATRRVSEGQYFDEHWNGMPGRLQTGVQSDLISQVQRDAFERLTAIPSDGQATFRLWDLARDLRLEESHQPRGSDERSMLLAREQELMAQLQPLENISATREGLLARRRQLEADLDRARRASGGKYYAPATDEHHRMSDRVVALDRDCDALRAQIADVENAIARLRDGQLVDQTQSTYREQLLSLDAQLARWRNTLTEIRAHRERLESASTDAHLDGQLGEQFTPVNQATPRLALRSLEAQITEARRHFDALVEGVDRYRDSHESVRHELPQTLRLMQRELHEVCQQLSRQESLTTSRAMRDQIQQLSRCENEMKLAVERLIAERGDLLRTIATACQLSVDQVSLAYSDSCRCADHPHLDAWLNAVGKGPLADVTGTRLQPKFFDELNDLESRRQNLVAQLEAAERDRLSTDSRLRHLGMANVAGGAYDRAEAELLRELDMVNEDILRLETRDRLRVDLVDVRRRLQHLPHEVDDALSLRGRYLRHLAGLTGTPIERATQELFRDQLVRDASAPQQYAYDRRPLDARYGAPVLDRRYEPVRGHYVSHQFSSVAPEARIPRLEEVALRLAIVDVLATKGHSLPLVLDETLDGLQGPHLLTALRYLAGHSDVAHQQVIALTDDQQLAETVKSLRGNVVPLAVSHAVQAAAPAPAYVDYDVNRHLTAVANDFEMAKWSEPEWAPPVVRPEARKRWVLTERSDIHEVPSIGAHYAPRLRALDVHRVADLLDADAESLAHSLRISGVDGESVRAWQSECRLLCAMPQLRPFDARVLAGAGIRDHRQLNEMDPARLLERVENFLATERGKQIMRSGSPHELSRLTAWVASAKRGSSDGRERSTFDSHSSNGARRTSVRRTESAHDAVPTYHIVERDDDRAERTARRPREDRRRDRQRAEAEPAASNRRERTPRASNGSTKRDNESRSKFYLELSSPVVDAPSIGATMARSLEDVGVVTVHDLLNANADDLAADLGQPRVTGAIIRAWQDQSRLVCRIPNLRGHDAQILVACGITSPESLTRMEPTALLAQTSAFASSTQGQRVLRGSQAPDLEEVKQWISWAANSRNLMAA